LNNILKMKLLALVTILSSVCLISSFELSRVKRQGNERLKDLKLYINSGASCGGYFVFAKICEKGTTKCCEEKISETFDSFSMIAHMFNTTCKSFGIDTKKTYTISLDSFEDSTRSKQDNFCPLKAELTTTRGNLFVTNTKIADGLIKSVQPQNLIYLSLQKPSQYFDEIHVEVGPGTSCGGHFVFAEICDAGDADNKKCCMDQITPDPYEGFKAGRKFIGKFRNCSSTMDVRNNGKDYILKLSSFNEITRDSKESFCPAKAIIKTKGGVGMTKTLKFPNKVREHKVEGRFNLRLQPRSSSQYFEKINVKIESGVSCGGYYLFAKICTRSEFTCCEEQIVPDPKSGFSGGTQISELFSGDCKSFPIQIHQNLTLSGWNDDSKKSEESFCPSTVKVTTNNNAEYQHTFTGSRQNSVTGELTQV
jgi:hypothetical protein